MSILNGNLDVASLAGDGVLEESQCFWGSVSGPPREVGRCLHSHRICESIGILIDMIFTFSKKDIPIEGFRGYCWFSI